MADHDAPESDARQGPGHKRKGIFRRHKALTALGVLICLAALVVAGGVFYLNHKLDQIDRVPIAIPEVDRPQPAPTPEGKSHRPLNILIAGADNGPGPSIAAAMKSGKWDPGAHRSDTIMILHITADRDHAYLVSIPRDSYVEIYDGKGHSTGKHKINSAFSLYGPAGYVSTIEHLTNVRMDHLAIIDWNGFKDLTNALGGVTVYIPKTVHDSSQNVTWHKGYQHLNGAKALKYVRTRHGLPNGDFDRMRRQQNFLRTMMGKTLDEGMTSPTKLPGLLDAVTKNLTVDDDWSNGDLRSLALSLRGMRTDDVTFLSVPLAKDWNEQVEGEGSVVLLDTQACNRLWTALRDGGMQKYVDDHSAETLGSKKTVN